MVGKLLQRGCKVTFTPPNTGARASCATINAATAALSSNTRAAASITPRQRLLDGFKAIRKNCQPESPSSIGPNHPNPSATFHMGPDEASAPSRTFMPAGRPHALRLLRSPSKTSTSSRWLANSPPTRVTHKCACSKRALPQSSNSRASNATPFGNRKRSANAGQDGANVGQQWVNGR